jgi:hypothetical protein
VLAPNLRYDMLQRRMAMIADRRGSDLVEWIVGLVIVIAIVGTAVFAVFNSVGAKFWSINSGLQ